MLVFVSTSFLSKIVQVEATIKSFKAVGQTIISKTLLSGNYSVACINLFQFISMRARVNILFYEGSI